jgi:hypothetical protein
VGGDKMMEDPHAFDNEEKLRTLKLTDDLIDVAEQETIPIVVAAIGSLLTFVIVNAASNHNGALKLVKHFTEQLVNSIDDAFTK